MRRYSIPLPFVSRPVSRIFARRGKHPFCASMMRPYTTAESFNPEDLWEWMAAYYCCTLGDVMNAALPAGLKLSSETRFVLVVDEDESEWDKRGVIPSTLEEQLSPFGGGMSDVISPKVMSMNVSGQKFQDYDTLYVDVINCINNLTSVGKTFTQSTAPQLNFTITNDTTKTDEENYQYNSRRVISKIIGISEIIKLGFFSFIIDSNLEFFKVFFLICCYFLVVNQ